MSPELSIVVPTFNEQPNIEPLLQRIWAVFPDRNIEVIFVDDQSTDGTPSTIRRVAQNDPRVRLVSRIRGDGLASACVDGMQSAGAPFVAVMDADLQHDETILPKMLQAVRDEGYDIAVGSRHAVGGGLGEWSEDRQQMSDLATRIAQVLVGTKVKDPMSGFFLLKRETIDASVNQLSLIGFKILLDILATNSSLKVTEIPYIFRNRHAGESKLSAKVMLEYLGMIIDKKIGVYLPLRFLTFAAAGGIGLSLHLVVLLILHAWIGFGFLGSHIIATYVAMTLNFFSNQRFSYSQVSKKSTMKMAVPYFTVCTLGAIANFQIADYMFELGGSWVLAGGVGILIGAVWNYTVSNSFVWYRK